MIEVKAVKEAMPQEEVKSIINAISLTEYMKGYNDCICRMDEYIEKINICFDEYYVLKLNSKGNPDDVCRVKDILGALRAFVAGGLKNGDA